MNCDKITENIIKKLRGLKKRPKMYIDKPLIEKQQKIETDEIDISVSAQRLSESFELGKTYFLDGVWGSGKTTYLKKFKRACYFYWWNYGNKRNSSKINVQKSTRFKYFFIRFVELKLWEKKGEKSVIRYSFKRVHCILAIFLWLSVPLAVAISILATTPISLGLEVWIRGWDFFSDDTIDMAIRLGIGISLLISIIGILKVKSDDFFLSMLQNLPRFRKRVIIVDDFDRLDNTLQKEVYTLFNLLKHKRWYQVGKITFLFVGDYSQIYGFHDDGYLAKIIDRKIALPYHLQPRYVWVQHFDKVYQNLEIPLEKHKEEIKAFKTLFEHDTRTLRDLSHFNDYVNQEFFIRSKHGYVNPFEQLYIIYAYLFRPEFYQHLVLYPKTYRLGDNRVAPGHENWSLENVVSNILKQSNRNSFSEKPISYFIGEDTSNLLDTDIIEMLDNPDIEDLFKNPYENPKFQDIRKYLMDANIEDTKTVLTQKLFRLAMRYYIRDSDNILSKVIIEEKLLQLVKANQFSDYVTYTENEFNISDYDVTEKIHFMLKSSLLTSSTSENHFGEIRKRYQNEWNLDDFNEYKKPAYFLPFYFHVKADWTVEIWSEYFENLNDNDFATFCLYAELPLNRQTGRTGLDVTKNGIFCPKVSELFINKALRYDINMRG